jgi:hypothetical protein
MNAKVSNYVQNIEILSAVLLNCYYSYKRAKLHTYIKILMYNNYILKCIIVAALLGVGHGSTVQIWIPQEALFVWFILICLS